jgi:hypothetical protein
MFSWNTTPTINTKPSRLKKITKLVQDIELKLDKDYELDAQVRYNVIVRLNRYIDLYGMNGQLDTNETDHNAVISDLMRLMNGEANSAKTHSINKIVKNIEVNIHAKLADGTLYPTPAQKPPSGANLTRWEHFMGVFRGSNAAQNQTDVSGASIHLDSSQHAPPPHKIPHAAVLFKPPRKDQKRFMQQEDEEESQYLERLKLYIKGACVCQKEADKIKGTTITIGAFLDAMHKDETSLSMYVKMNLSAYMIEVKNDVLKTHAQNDSIKLGQSRLLPILCRLRSVDFHSEIAERYIALNAKFEVHIPQDKLSEIKHFNFRNADMVGNALMGALEQQLTSEQFYGQYGITPLNVLFEFARHAESIHDMNTILTAGCLITTNQQIMNKIEHNPFLMGMKVDYRQSKFIIVRAYRTIDTSAAAIQRRALHAQLHRSLKNVFQGAYRKNYYENLRPADLITRLAFWANNTDDAYMHAFNENPTFFTQWIDYALKSKLFEINEQHTQMSMLTHSLLQAINTLQTTRHIFRSPNGTVYIQVTPELWTERHPPPPPAPPKKIKTQTQSAREERFRALMSNAISDIMKQHQGSQPSRDISHGLSSHDQKSPAQVRPSVLNDDRHTKWDSSSESSDGESSREREISGASIATKTLRRQRALSRSSPLHDRRVLAHRNASPMQRARSTALAAGGNTSPSSSIGRSWSDGYAARTAELKQHAKLFSDFSKAPSLYSSSDGSSMGAVSHQRYTQKEMDIQRSHGRSTAVARNRSPLSKKSVLYSPLAQALSNDESDGSNASAILYTNAAQSHAFGDSYDAFYLYFNQHEGHLIEYATEWLRKCNEDLDDATLQTLEEQLRLNDNIRRQKLNDSMMKFLSTCCDGFFSVRNEQYNRMLSTLRIGPQWVHWNAFKEYIETVMKNEYIEHARTTHMPHEERESSNFVHYFEQQSHQLYEAAKKWLTAYQSNWVNGNEMITKEIDARIRYIGNHSTSEAYVRKLNHYCDVFLTETNHIYNQILRDNNVDGRHLHALNAYLKAWMIIRFLEHGAHN